MEQGTTTNTPVIDSGKQKDGKGWKITTVIACIVGFCGIGFGVYELINSGNKTNQIVDLQNQISNFQSQTITNEDNETKTEEGDSAQRLAIDFAPYNSRQSRIDVSKCLMGCAEGYKYISQPELGILLHQTEDNRGEITVKGYSGLAGEYKIDFDSQITNAYLASFGNGGNLAILFLKQYDGSIEYAFPYEDYNVDKLNVYDLDGVEDVVYFVEVDGLDNGHWNLTVLAVRSDGYFYDLGSTLNAKKDELYRQNHS